MTGAGFPSGHSCSNFLASAVISFRLWEEVCVCVSVFVWGIGLVSKRPGLLCKNQKHRLDSDV